MSFVHPWALLMGIVAAAAPVVVHLLTRPRPVRLPLSTLRFLREAVHQRRARHLLRDIVILSLRTMAVLLIALAVARPRLGEQPLVSDRQAGDAVRVVILDVSQSMAAAERGIQAIERGRTTAARHLRYAPGLQANLILAGATPRAVFDGPSANFDALRDELARCQALPQRMDVNRALELASRLLAPESADDTRRRELVVVSDFQRTAWSKADLAGLPENTQIQLELVVPQERPSNLAILRAETRAVSAANGAMQLEVDVANYSPSVRQVAMEVNIAQGMWRLKGTCPPGRVITLSEEIELRRAGWQAGEARFVGADDALAADNVRYFASLSRAETVYVLLTRQAPGRPSSSRYIECALVPDAAAEGVSPVRRLDPSQADAASLGPCDLIVLDHPGKLSDETIKLLAGLMRRGRPILYVASELIDATNLKRIGEATGGSLRMPVEFIPAAAGQPRRNLFLTAVRREESPFRVFGDTLDAVMGELRFAGGLSSRKLERGVNEDVLASFRDGSAFLVLVASDAGALAVLNADLNESNLAKHSAFVPLLSELTRRLLDRNRRVETAHCGESLLAQIPNDVGTVAGLRIVGPTSSDPAGKTSSDLGEGDFGRLSDETVNATWSWPSPERPGVYRVERDDQPVFCQAINVPAEESDLEPLSPEVLRDRLAAGRAVYYRSCVSEGDQRDDLWKWFAVACVACMLSEIGAMLAFRD